VTDDRTVDFTIDGYNFSKSIKDANALIRELERKIAGWPEPSHENGYVTYWGVRGILHPHLIRQAGYKDTDDDREMVTQAVWNRICTDNADRMFCSHCHGKPQGIMHDTKHWDIDFDVLIEYVVQLIAGETLYDDIRIRNSFVYLRDYLKGILIACRP
jgi:hypothetical protein